MTYGWRRVVCTLYWAACIHWFGQMGAGDTFVLVVRNPFPLLDDVLGRACDSRGVRLKIRRSKFREYGFLARFMIPEVLDNVVMIFLDDDMLFLYPVIPFLRGLPHDGMVGIYGRNFEDTSVYNFRDVVGECDALLTKAVRVPAQVVRHALAIGRCESITNGEDLLLSRINTQLTNKKPVAFDPPGIAIDVGILDNVVRRIFYRHGADRARIVQKLWGK